MKNLKYILMAGLLCAACLLWIDPSLAQAAQAAAADGSGYLSSYKEADPHPSQSSWWSTLAYLISLLAVFVFVLAMAYFVSRFLGGRFARFDTRTEGKLLENLPLGPGKSVCAVEIAGKVLLLGVAEHGVTLLQEITDEKEIEKLRLQSREAVPVLGLDKVFSQQLSSLDKISRRLPALFKDGRYRK